MKKSLFSLSARIVLALLLTILIHLVSDSRIVIADTHDNNRYISYDNYQALIDSVATLKNPRLANLTPAGQKAWENGQMRVPTSNVWVSGDFNQNNREDLAVLVHDDYGQHLIVGEISSSDSWDVTDITPLQKSENSLQVDQELIVLAPRSIVKWANGSYQLLRGIEAAKVQWEKNIKHTDWRWSGSSGINLFENALINLSDYELHAVKSSKVWRLAVSIRQNGKILHSWKSNSNGAVVQYGDYIYYTEFSPFTTGMTVVAYNLSKKEEAWKTQLKGVGPVAHSKYRNFGAMLSVREDILEVTGKEIYSGYVEIIDRSSGASLANRVYPDVHKAP